MIFDIYAIYIHVQLVPVVKGAVASWLVRLSPGSSPGRGQCVVFLAKTPSYHSASRHLQVYESVPENVMQGVIL